MANSKRASYLIVKSTGRRINVKPDPGPTPLGVPRVKGGRYAKTRKAKKSKKK